MFQFTSKSLKVAIGFSFVIALCLMTVSFVYSREIVFLWLNNDLGKSADLFFNGMSHLAEGWMWIPYFLLMFGWLKKDSIFILLNFLFSTLLTQIPKQTIWADVHRPMASGIDPHQIHLVDGVEVHTLNSFPSGHTATAFTLYFVTLYFFPKKSILAVGLIYALLCGYSRVYLGQHFPLDVAGGIVVAILSILISLFTKKIIQDVKKN